MSNQRPILTPYRSLATLTKTSSVTEVTTEIDGTVTTTIPALVTSIAVAPKKRDIASDPVPYPAFLPTTYSSWRVSLACSCLSIPASVAASTVTAAAVTLTASETVTELATSTVHTTLIATETAAPIPVVTPVTNLRVTIEVLRKDTQVNVGWLYYSSGVAIASTLAQAATVNFTLPGGATTASQVRINMEGQTPAALGFTKGSNPNNIVELEKS